MTMQLDGDAERVVRTAIALAEAYVAFAFVPRNSNQLGLLGDQLRLQFRDYVRLAHPELEERVVEAEARAKSPLIIVQND